MAEIASAFVSIIPSMKGFASKLASQGSSETAAAGGVLGKTLGRTMLVGFAAAGIAVGVGKVLYSIGSEFDDMNDTIRASTGKSGAALAGLEESAKNVGKRVPVAFSAIGPVIADLNRRLGLTGKPLEKLAAQFLDLGHITGTAVDTKAVTSALSIFNVKGAQASTVMDQLFRVSQSTGVTFNDLAASLARNGPALSQFGFSINQSASLIGSLSKAGIDSNKTLGTLSKAMATFAKAGQDPQKALRDTITQIQGFIKAGDQAAAVNTASGIFGTRGAVQFVAAVKSGRLNVEQLTAATKGNHDTIFQATKDTSDFAETWQIFKNRVLVAIEPIATRVFSAFSTGALQALPAVTRFVNQMQSGKGQGGQFADNLRSVGAVLERLGKSLLQVAGFLNQNRQVLVAVVAAYAAWKTVLVASVVATKLQAASDGIATAALAVHTAAVRLSTSTFGTRIGVMAIDAAAWVRSTASTVASTVATTANNVVTRLSSLNLGTRLGLLAGSIAAWVASTAATVANTVATVASVVAQKAAAVAAKAWAVAQWLLNVAMDANPIGLIVVGIAALVAGLILAYKHSETFRNIVNGAFNAIKAVVVPTIAFIVDFVRSHWGLLVSLIGGPVGIVVVQVIKHFGTIKSIVGAVATFVVDSAKKYAQFAKAVIDKVGDVVSFFKELPGKIKGFLAGLPGDLARIGGQIIEGLVRGIQGAAGKVASAVKAIVDKIPSKIRSIMGIASPSKVTAELGRFIGDGLADGIASKTGKVSDATQKLVDATKAKLDDLKQQFSSIKDSVASAFTGDLFSATNAADFLTNLTSTHGTLAALSSAFRKLVKEGVAPSFLSALFQSGNAPLILDLASGSRSQALAAASEFGAITNLSDKLGGQVAQADLGKKIDKTNDQLAAILKATKRTGEDVARALNNVSSNAGRRARAA